MNDRHNPGRSDLSTLEQLNAQIEESAASRQVVQAAQQLAHRHRGLGHTRSRRERAALYTDFAAIAALLARSHRYFRAEATSTRAVSFAAEWMLDNYYIIQQALREIEQDLPPGYYVELPSLGDEDAFGGYPRIYAVAAAIGWEAGYQLDKERIVRFVLAYQTQQPLETGELWALPTMLRLVLLQITALATGRLAGELSEHVLPASLAAFQAAAAQSGHASSENDEMAVARAIPSLHLLDAMDWADTFERISLVHRSLLQDPAGVYAQVDFQTRNHYREVVETLHRRVEIDEVAIADLAVSLAAGQQATRDSEASRPSSSAREAADSSFCSEAERAAHVGYYLIDKGRTLLEQALGYRPPFTTRLRRWLFHHATSVYLTAVGAGALTAIAVVSAYALAAGGGLLAVVAVWILAAIPALTAGVGATNWIITHTAPPRILPKLDLQHGIPPSCRTALVIPALIETEDDIDELVEQLEQHHLRNPDPELIYGLLTDFVDASQETEAGDEHLLQYAAAAIETINGRAERAPFFLLHRRRQWNPAQQRWMGWERKRGKLHEFNRLIRGAADTSYTWCFGNLNSPESIRYVITLDADTVLPRAAAVRLVGTIAHPLNRALFDDSTGKVIAGYTILQPRTEIKPVSAGRSLFAQIYTGDNSLDLYTLAVSDAYQDFFGAGIYVGKGIYDVDAFERSLDGRVPENTLLSHDLFEGMHGRVALATDIVVYEDYPSHFLLNMQRSHRWVRGDWQLLPWLLPRVPAAEGYADNDLALIDRWKILDNLRRSLFAAAALVFFIVGWTILPGSPVVWTLLGLLMPALAVGAALAVGNLRWVAGRARWGNGWREARESGWRWLAFLVFLPYAAQLNLDAMARTLTRTFVTHRLMLEWTTAAQAARIHSDGGSAQARFRRVLPSILFVTALSALILATHPGALIVAAPFFVAWTLSAQIADWLSRPTVHKTQRLTAQEQRTLHTLARRTWLFYESFVGPEDNWLPPDHFQESPRGTVAHRTSPTNIGLYLLSALAAFDFGYLRMANFVLRVKFTFDTLDRMDRHRGHFLNWIDTSTLHPLPPAYVSTVDSGNLAAAMVALQQACIELKQQSVWRPVRWQGLLDTIGIVSDTLQSTQDSGGTQSATIAALRDCLAEIEASVEKVIADPACAVRVLAELLGPQREELDRRLRRIAEDESAPVDARTLHTIRLYIARVGQHLDGMRSERDEAMPWLALLASPPEYFDTEERSESLRRALERLNSFVPSNPRWEEVGDHMAQVRQELGALRALLAATAADPPGAQEQAVAWCDQFDAALDAATENAISTLRSLNSLAERAGAFVMAMDFRFLYDPHRALFHIGYNVDSGELDASYYDLIASEARLASLLAIGKNDVPVKHWIHLGRPLTQPPGSRAAALLSWSGTMFEYLMPPLLLRTYPETLFDQSYASVIDRQINFAHEKSIPWGISESGFYAFDAALNYQYRAFGVPGLGLRRGLGEDLVVAPYASLLALPIRPRPVLSNLQHFEQADMLGTFGLYEAVDYTPERLSLGRESAVVQSYMAHHQGMILLALADTLLERRMIERFHAAPIVKSVELLLQEQIPHEIPLQFAQTAGQELAGVLPPIQEIAPWPVPADSPMPLAHYLSNGSLSELITNAGGGFLAASALQLTRWRSDTTLDDWGNWLYLQNLDSGELWSAGRQPTGHHGTYEEVIFHPHMAEFRRRSGAIALHMETFVAPEANVAVRHIAVTNEGDEPLHVGLTSYGEVVLASADADRRHQAFAKLFVETEILADMPGLLFRRRPRAAAETPACLLHLLVRGPGATENNLGLTRRMADRAAFIGRSGTPRAPAALQEGGWWENEPKATSGATLDPVMAFGQELRLDAQNVVHLAYVTIYGSSRAEVLSIAESYSSWNALQRARSRAQSQMSHEMRQLGFTSTLFRHALELLSLAIYPHHTCRADPATLAANSCGQSSLWAYGISGDYPILLVHLAEESHGELLQELLQIHAYWRRRGLKIDLVVVNDRDSSYDQGLHSHIFRVIRRLSSETALNQRGGIFILRWDQMSSAERTLLDAVARVVLDGRHGDLAQQLGNLFRQPPSLPRFEPVCTEEHLRALQSADPGWLTRPANLQFANGYGGFSPDGKEYVIYLEPGQVTPAPWINVIANPEFGFITSESGSGASWSLNSGENRLSTWRNDPVMDNPAEIIYLRDEETADVWTPTPQPTPAAAPYCVRHGAGYTTYEHHSHAIRQQLTLWCAADAPVKFMRLRLENAAPVARHLTVTCYVEWVLGVDRATTQATLVSEYDEKLGALFARNGYAEEFGGRVAFLTASKAPHGATADRSSFLGRLGSLDRPAALGKIGLDGNVQAGIDPCAALQVHIDLATGAAEQICFILGEGADRRESSALIEHFRDEASIEAAWQQIRNEWEALLGSIVVETPDPAMDLLLNRWLPYQALACRLWGRSALYQSSGAYGFRDQLQDVMAFFDTRPDIARTQILRAAGQQFAEGDVLHWWHPPSGRGVRTRISDDLLWLPAVTAAYVAATGDSTILEERVPFLTGLPLADAEEERYGHYRATEESFPLLEHCRRAIERGVTAGPHGIPLIGAGDWNDGMNRVGIEGKGESIWLGWFTCATLRAFADLWDAAGQAGGDDYRRKAGQVAAAIEAHGWDGAWYRRAYYDDGTPLGSAENRECRIDALAQAWAVLSGAAEAGRARQAMNAVLAHLVKEEERLLLLFTPPLDRTAQDPGYIKGYVPGIRENGGQYTHAALWSIWAFAELGDAERATDLFRLLNPILRSDTPARAEHYKVEPYVISADVYGVAPHVGRGGWTWYTGSAAWMMRLGREAILGLHKEQDTVRIDPCIPATWPGYQVCWRYGSSIYQIDVQNRGGPGRAVTSMRVDGRPCTDHRLHLVDDGLTHQVAVEVNAVDSSF